MTVITRTGEGEAVGEESQRMAEISWGIAETARVLLSHKKGDVGEVMETIGRCHRMGGAEALERVVREGLPAEIGKSASKYGGELLTKTAADVALGRAIVFQVKRTKDRVGLSIPQFGRLRR